MLTAQVVQHRLPSISFVGFQQHMKTSQKFHVVIDTIVKHINMTYDTNNSTKKVMFYLAFVCLSSSVCLSISYQLHVEKNY